MRDARRLPPDSSTTGSGDALDQLEQDHRRVEQLFARSALVAGPARLALVPLIADELTTHAELEEGLVYPAIGEAVAGADLMVARAEREHDEMKRLLERLQAADEDGAALLEDLRALQLVVQAHVAVEEGELFPAYRTSAPADAQAALTEAAAARRSAAVGAR